GPHRDRPEATGRLMTEGTQSQKHETKPASHDFVLKRDDTFLVVDAGGDIRTDRRIDHGLYLNDTRHLSQFELRIGGTRPLRLAANLTHDSALLSVDLANPEVYGFGDQGPLQREEIYLSRDLFVWQQALFERIRIQSFAPSQRLLVVQHVFDADYLDIFEVRGETRPSRGEVQPVDGGRQHVQLAYVGRDAIRRETVLWFDQRPDRLSPTASFHEILLDPRGRATLTMRIVCRQYAGESVELVLPEVKASYRAVRRAQRERSAGSVRIITSNELFNEWLNRSISDLHLLTSQTEHGLYPYAGIPWYNTAFGRDGLITALQCLWFEPRLARGVLRFLAATQAKTHDARRDSAPGKVLHETRKGEMARLGEVPFGAYYGSVDATPLFVMLAGAYYNRTEDLTLVEEIWPAVTAALRWIDDYGDIDGDGFVDYRRESEKGLRNQGWKDSEDAVSHADGRLAESPISLCEVQGYVYAARRSAAVLAEALGYTADAAGLRRQAEWLREKFDRTFWIDELKTYALALDGDKMPCKVLASNAGHLLLTGIVPKQHAKPLVETLLSAQMYSGWGIRTLGSAESRYNPMSYHNGSIWPHDNALIGMGMAEYGFRAEAVRVLTGLFDASLFMSLHRMPELFCGFKRRPGARPADYAESCAPQAWSSAAVCGLLDAILGLKVDARTHQARIEHPVLPPYLKWVRLSGVMLGTAEADLEFKRDGDKVAVTLNDFRGDIKVSMQS
ncbi:MAG TPA: amylo-alpha-1,6-glucosidase, partial [Gammaproteobacteria bacterium]|nr:amylo-alpha-1,6-glucosidase [Gammaproteobacteria bacterium]